MGNSIRTYFIGIACNGQCLEDTFGTYGDGVGTVTQYVSEYHVS